MIKKWNEFIREFSEPSYSPDSASRLIDAKMQELKDLVDDYSDGHSLIYEWKDAEDHKMDINFSAGDLSVEYEFDIDSLRVSKSVCGEVDTDFDRDFESVDDCLSAIEADIHDVLGISEKAKTRGEKYKGRHVPAKYLKRKPDAMKKEIERFRGKKEYKKDWEADYDKRSGKRIKTKKSAASIAYQKKFGDK